MWNEGISSILDPSKTTFKRKQIKEQNINYTGLLEGFFNQNPGQ